MNTLTIVLMIVAGIFALLTFIAHRTNSRTTEALHSAREQRDKLQGRVQELIAEVSRLETNLEHSKRELAQRGELEERFSDAFRVLSADVLRTCFKSHLIRFGIK